MTSVPACKWGEQQTQFYRIHNPIPCNETDFFGKPTDELRQPNWRYTEFADFLQYALPEDLHSRTAGQDQVRELLLLLKSIHFRDRSAPIFPGEEDHLHQYNLTGQAIKLMLQFLGMGRRNCTVVRTNTHIILHQQGTFSNVTVDTAVQDETATMHRFLVITERTLHCTESTAFGQLMAGAIAAFQYDNEFRTMTGKTPLESMIFPGMIWTSFFPSFFRIKITRDLADSVKSGRRPKNDTYVAQLNPPIPDNLSSYGLWPLRSRAIVIKILENMKDLLLFGHNQVPSGWYRFMTEQEAEQLRNATAECSDDEEITTSDAEWFADVSNDAGPF